MTTIGERIRQRREALHLTKAELARRVEVSDVTISYWESGAIEQIGHLRLSALADALECPTDMLLGRDDPRIELVARLLEAIPDHFISDETAEAVRDAQVFLENDWRGIG